MDTQSRSYTGAIMLPLRLVTAWLFLSAVLRRLILAPGKHEFQTTQWLGHKINTFFPHANEPFRSGLDYLLQNPVSLDVFTYVFTFSELLLGLLLAAGFLSRFTGVFMAGLAIGLMHTAGWLGPTCLDEWQIASLLVTIGGVMALYGGGRFSADAWLMRKRPSLEENTWWKLLAFPSFDTRSPRFRKIAVAIPVILVLYVIATNQVHHGGVWGPLHNYSKKPGITLSEAAIDDNDTFSFTAFRDKGPEAYGSFIVEVTIKNSKGQAIHTFNDEFLKQMPSNAIENVYVNKIHTGENSLVIPLGAKAELTFSVPGPEELRKGKNYTIEMTEIGGRTFTVQTKTTE